MVVEPISGDNVSALFAYDETSSTLFLIGDSTVALQTITYEIGYVFYNVGTTNSAGAGLVDTFTVDWSNSDLCVYTVFDPDPTTQTFAFS